MTVENTVDLPALILQYGTVGFILAIEAWFVWAVFTKEINLKLLVSEKNGDASLSRFQLLLFTFAIIGLYISFGFASDSSSFPEINENTLWLLGISGGTYGGSKAIQMSRADTSPNSGQFVRK